MNSVRGLGMIGTKEPDDHSADTPMPCTEPLATTKPRALAVKPISNASRPRHRPNTDIAQTCRPSHHCSLVAQKSTRPARSTTSTRQRHAIRSPMTEKAISPLRQRLIEDMTIRRLSPETQHHYIRHVKSFADFT